MRRKMMPYVLVPPSKYRIPRQPPPLEISFIPPHSQISQHSDLGRTRARRRTIIPQNSLLRSSAVHDETTNATTVRRKSPHDGSQQRVVADDFSSTVQKGAVAPLPVREVVRTTDLTPLSIPSSIPADEHPNASSSSASTVFDTRTDVNYDRRDHQDDDHPMADDTPTHDGPITAQREQAPHDMAPLHPPVLRRVDYSDDMPCLQDIQLSAAVETADMPALHDPLAMHPVVQQPHNVVLTLARTRSATNPAQGLDPMPEDADIDMVAETESHQALIPELPMVAMTEGPDVTTMPAEEGDDLLEQEHTLEPAPAHSQIPEPASAAASGSRHRSEDGITQTQTDVGSGRIMSNERLVSANLPRIYLN